MKAMVLEKLVDLTKNDRPLKLLDLNEPKIEDSEVLIEVRACGVCHTELDEIEGRTPPNFFPIVLGHQVVGKIIEAGKTVSRYKTGQRVGVAWIYSSCGRCYYCKNGSENLCPEFKATGRDAHGGYAQLMKAKESFIFPIPDNFTDIEAAPLLCAGAIGYRSLKLTGMKDGQRLGLVGFGASAHLVLKMVKHLYPNATVLAFSRTERERDFALQLGASWAGEIEESPPEQMECAIDTTPVWRPVVTALRNLKPGGRLVINAIRKESVDIQYLTKIDYSSHLWLEKEIKSVANVTTADVAEFIKLASQIPIKPQVETFSLEEANQALMELKQRKIKGAKVLKIK